MKSYNVACSIFVLMAWLLVKWSMEVPPITVFGLISFAITSSICFIKLDTHVFGVYLFNIMIFS